MNPGEPVGKARWRAPAFVIAGVSLFGCLAAACAPIPGAEPAAQTAPLARPGPPPVPLGPTPVPFVVPQYASTYSQPDPDGNTRAGDMRRGLYGFTCWTPGERYEGPDRPGNRVRASNIWAKTTQDSQERRDVYISELDLDVPEPRGIQSLLPRCQQQ